MSATDSPDPVCLEVRVRLLETQLLRLRRRTTRLVALCAVLVIGFLVSQPFLVRAQATRPAAAEVVRTEALQIVDGRGRVIIELGSKHDQPFLRMLDSSLDERVYLGVTRVHSGDVGPLLALSYEGKSRLQLLGPSHAQYPAVCLTGKDEKGTTAEAELCVIGASPQLWLLKDNQRIFEAVPAAPAR